MKNVINLTLALLVMSFVSIYSATNLVSVTTQSDFDAKVLQSSKPVVVKFFATWCGSCKKMKPIVDSIAAEYGSSYDFIEVDVDKASAVADRYNIKNLPTIIFFKNGKQLGSAIGDSSRASLVASMQKALG